MAVGGMFSRNARIMLRIRQQAGAECYGTLADDRNTTPGDLRRRY